jgi:Flp pilus assembly protein TadG
MRDACKTRSARHLPLRERRGGLTIEMILVVVVLAIVTVAVVQFGVFYANADQVALAAPPTTNYSIG